VTSATAAPAPNLGRMLQSFFNDYLTTQRALSPNTLLSYRDTFKLFLVFAAQRSNKTVAELGFGHLTPEIVLAFLDHVEKKRHCSVRTRNARLAALHTFFRYVAGREPGLLDLCQRVSAIPVKKSLLAASTYLERDEVEHVLADIDCSTTLGRRDHLLLLLLFETGMRAQEIASLSTDAVRLAAPPQLRVLGKGGKERICPLRTKTARQIRAYLAERDLSDTGHAPLFVGVRREPLTRIGVLRMVQRRVRHAAKTLPTLASKRVGAHTFRHAAAIHLLRSGNDLSVVRSWLGHVSVVTTDRYTEIDTETKRRALEASDPTSTRQRRPSWKRRPELLAWLEAL
jgi:site-specific recombinase XerD